MLYQYYGSFAPGLEDCIAEVLKERFQDLTIPLLLSGALVFETTASYDRLNLFCFNNIFRVISSDPAGKLEKFVMNTIARGEGGEIIAESGPRVKPGTKTKQAAPSFRVMFSRENTPAAVDESLRHEAESYIASLSGLKVNRSKPDTEFWFLERREGSFFMKRLSRHGSWDKTLHPGELPPPLAWTLCWLSRPKYGEKSADPFCGYGAISEARLRHFPPGDFFASDSDPKALAYSKNKFKGKDSAAAACHFNLLDAGDLLKIIPPGKADFRLDSIVTDPPWGSYEKTAQGIGELYDRCLKVFAEILKPGGLLVLLCGRDSGLETTGGRNHFTVLRSISVLVSGKKAAILVLQNKADPQADEP
jgi:SAM-dependent methyltransferase